MSAKKLAIILIAVFLIAVLSASEINAGARASGTPVYNVARVNVGCWGMGFSGATCNDLQFAPLPATCWRAAFCPTAWAAGWAFASWPVMRATARTGVTWGWASAGKDGAEDTVCYVEVDTTTCMAIDLGGALNIDLSGRVHGVKAGAAILTIKVFQNNDTTDIAFNGSAIINIGQGTVTTTEFDPGYFIISYAGDTMIVDYTFYHGPIPYEGSIDGIRVILEADPTNWTSVPSLNEYGVVVLAILILGSGVWVFYRRRRAAAI